MIELTHDSLSFSFPEVHNDAKMSIEFQRTLRIPDDEKTHFLPPGLGNFPLKHVDDYASKVPASWKEHGGVMLPMFQSDALWINFTSFTGYPFLLKIASGKINAITGEEWIDGPNRDPQDYVVVPEQPWLDGYCVKKGEVRQFVAMPLGKGYTAEEQITGKAEVGGVQIVAYPMKKEEWEKRKGDSRFATLSSPLMECCMSMEMGLAPGGRMKQDITEDPYPMDVWDLRNSSRCFVHIANSLNWRAITGEAPPTIPPTAKDYSDAGLPWFDLYQDSPAVEGSETLSGMKSVKDLSAEKEESVLPENESVATQTVLKLGDKENSVVREDFEQ
jgi:hypothetical protein